MASNRSIGPVLPSEARDVTVESSEESECDSHDNVVGPALPEHLRKSHTPDKLSVCIGPALPPQNSNTSSQSYDDLYGPALPPHLKNRIPAQCTDECDDDDLIGPVPQDAKYSASQHQLDIRAQYLKRKMNEERHSHEEKTKRESWMLELPPEKAANIGLGPRSFRMKERPDMSDRSGWTDTPEDKKRKNLLAEAGIDPGNKSEDMHDVAIKERDKAMEKMAAKCKSEKRASSLLEMHQKEQRKKQKKEEKERKGAKPERRPFDRNIDLQANRFDEAQKKSIFKKAQLLDTRFSQGQSKFL